jgi:hypothetical protein
MYKCLEPRSGDRNYQSFAKAGAEAIYIWQQDHFDLNIFRMLCRRSAAQIGVIGFTQSSQSLALGLALALLRSSSNDRANLIRVPSV